MYMSRPKESTYGLISGTASLYSASKVRKLGKDFDNFTNSIQSGLDANFNAINSVADLQVATLAGIHQLSQKLEVISESQWELVKFFEDRHQEQERLGDLKLLLREIDKEVKKITTLSKEHPVYATYLAEKLKNTFDSMDVRIEHFKMLTVSEIDWAEEIIDSVNNLFVSLYSNLGD